MSEPDKPSYPIFPEEGQQPFSEQPFILSQQELTAVIGLWLKKFHGWNGNVYVSWKTVHMMGPSPTLAGKDLLQLQIHPIFTTEDLLKAPDEQSS